MPLVRKLRTKEDGLMTYRAWVSHIDLVKVNDDLSYEELMKKIENYKMDPDRYMCINIEDVDDVFSWLKYGKADTKYADWNYFQWVLINSLPNDDNTLVFKACILEEIENLPSNKYHMLRCEIKLMEDHHLALKMRRTSVLNIHTSLRNERQANCLGRGQKLWYEMLCKF